MAAFNLADRKELQTKWKTFCGSRSIDVTAVKKAGWYGRVTFLQGLARASRADCLTNADEAIPD